MKKKHFKLLAEAISKVDDLPERKHLAKEIGKVCESQNTRFDWYKWDEACNCPKL